MNADARATALRLTLQDLDNTIRHCRTCIRKNSPRKAEFLAKYLELVRSAHQAKDRVQADSAIVLAICAPHLPMPIREQLVGYSEEDRRRLEWTPFETVTAPLAQAA